MSGRSLFARPARGQALVETLVVAIALVPLAVLVVLLGKYQSIRSATVAASRSLAFDCAARPADCADPARVDWLVQGLRQRHFDRQALWHDRAGRPLLERPSDVGGAVASQRFDAGLGTALGRAASVDITGIGGAGGIYNGSGFTFGNGAPGASAARLLDTLAGPARFGLAIEGGLSEARVQVAVAPSHAANAGFARLDPLALTMRARTVVLTDAWSASGPGNGAASVQARSSAGARLDAVRETRLAIGYQLTRWSIGLMGAIGLEPSAGDFRPQQGNPDAVPADRLGQP